MKRWLIVAAVVVATGSLAVVIGLAVAGKYRSPTLGDLETAYEEIEPAVAGSEAWSYPPFTDERRDRGWFGDCGFARPDSDCPNFGGWFVYDVDEGSESLDPILARAAAASWVAVSAPAEGCLDTVRPTKVAENPWRAQCDWAYERDGLRLDIAVFGPDQRGPYPARLRVGLRPASKPSGRPQADWPPAPCARATGQLVGKEIACYNPEVR